jgi:hypothetical protein
MNRKFTLLKILVLILFLSVSVNSLASKRTKPLQGYNWYNEKESEKKQLNTNYKPASYYRWVKSVDEYNALSPQIKKQEQELQRLKEELARLK